MAKIVFKAILPKKNSLINPKLENELVNALGKMGDIIRKDFNKTTRTWTKKPAFKKKGRTSRARGLAVEVFTNNEIYYYLNFGTKSHPVAPVRARALRFRAGYKAKSRVGIIGSRGGGAFGPTRFSKGHRVSGIKARGFDDTIAGRREKTLKSLVNLALLRGRS